MKFTKFDKIVEGIKTFKIQSAQNITKHAIIAIKDYSSDIDAITKTKFLDHLKWAKQQLFGTRPTEPSMRNALNFILHDLDGKTLSDLKKNLDRRIKQALEHIENVDSVVSEIGARKIKKNMIIFTHCHSSNVMSVLKKAKKQKKKFEIYNTETRPKFQGRITALELNEANIPVTHFVDLAAKNAIKKADIVLIGCDAIDSEGNCYNKIGSGMFAEIANKYDIPLYVITDSWKFDPKTVFGFDEEIEERSRKEVWPKAPSQIKIKNPQFEKIKPSLISGIISEIGIFKPTTFVQEIRSKYKFVFS